MKRETRAVNGTVVRRCWCKNEYQDRKYGLGMRVFNSAPGKDRKQVTRYRCSVCKRVTE